jgi:hypothetical protein
MSPALMPIQFARLQRWKVDRLQRSGRIKVGIPTLIALPRAKWKFPVCSPAATRLAIAGLIARHGPSRL